MFSGKINDLYDDWLEHLQLFEGAYIHFDWHDLMAREVMDGLAMVGVRAFELDSAEDWNAFFPASSVEFDMDTKLASISTGKTPDPDFVAYCLYGGHYISKQDASGRTDWIRADLVGDEDNIE